MTLLLDRTTDLSLDDDRSAPSRYIGTHPLGEDRAERDGRLLRLSKTLVRCQVRRWAQVRAVRQPRRFTTARGASRAVRSSRRRPTRACAGRGRDPDLSDLDRLRRTSGDSTYRSADANLLAAVASARRHFGPPPSADRGGSPYAFTAAMGSQGPARQAVPQKAKDRPPRPASCTSNNHLTPREGGVSSYAQST